MEQRGLRVPLTTESCVVGARETARCHVLVRACISFDTGAPCVLAAHGLARARNEAPS
jgi:hypothetical protein